jgi:surface antigen
MRIVMKRIFCGIMAAVVLAAGVGLVLPRVDVSADRLSELKAEQERITREVARLREQIAGYEDEASRLAGEAVTVANEVARLRAEENKLAAEIELNQKEHDRLAAEIEANEKKIQENKDALSAVLLESYNSKSVSFVERLASSRNLSSFVSKEAQLGNISDVLSGTVKEIETLKAELEEQKAELARILADLDAQKADMEGKRSEQQRILAETRGREAEFNGMKAEANSQKATLEDQQQKILAEIYALNNASGVTPGDPNKGGYPYSSKCPGAKLNGQQYADKWGMYICECVSYVAWKVHEAYGNMPYWGGKGNANQWLANARNAGIPTGTTPKVGAVGVTNGGPWGHVVWVQAVSGNRVYVSQYNARNAATNWLSGEYSETWVSASAYDGFIYFGEWKR